MTDNELDALLTLAEIAIGLAGFSAIVVLFKRGDAGTWRAAHSDRFTGMVVHAMAAALFGVLPLVVEVFAPQPSVLWVWCSGLLAVQVASHTGMVVWLASTGPSARAMVVLGGGAVVLLQGANVFGIGLETGGGPYVVGVIWHLLHAGGLFIALVWIPADVIEDR